MTDEPTPITPLAFTQHRVLTMDAPWPERTSIMPAVLQSPHVYFATYDEQAQTVTFDIFNGSATYKISGEVEAGGALVAELVDSKKTSRKV